MVGRITPHCCQEKLDFSEPLEPTEPCELSLPMIYLSFSAFAVVPNAHDCEYAVFIVFYEFLTLGVTSGILKVVIAVKTA